MKVIKKPKFKHQTCEQCRAVVEIKPKDIYILNKPFVTVGWKCPFCKIENAVDFEKGETNVKD